MAVKECNFCKKPASDEVKMKVCAGCGLVGYCCKECQTKDWKVHKKTCKKQHKKPSGNPHLRDGKQKDIPVLWEDQQRINAFGRLNNRMQELLDDAAVKKTAMAGLDDATGEIECLLDDDACKIRVGELYVQVSNEEAEEYAAEQKAAREKEIEAIAEEKAKLRVEMNKLKALLYAKFGNTINLETERNDD